jgi:hypothetical protein
MRNAIKSNAKGDGVRVYVAKLQECVLAKSSSVKHFAFPSAFGHLYVFHFGKNPFLFSEVLAGSTRMVVPV